jgi:integrase/recombinase XerD
MSALRAELTRYLELRRSLGHKLVLSSWMLSTFVTFMEEQSATRITTELALAWACSPAQTSTAWWAQRLSVVRCFARYLAAIDPATEVPPARMIAWDTGDRRVVPYPYTDADVIALARAASRLSPELRGANYETVFSLLATTGMRIGEAIALDESDVVLGRGLLHVRNAKFGKSRDIPLHESTVDALGDYRRRRDALAPSLPGSFFVSHKGVRLSYSSARSAFAECAVAVGLGPISKRCRPRLHDLRHRFARQALADLYARGADVEPLLPVLSSFLGHVEPDATYWYLRACPELFGPAAERLESWLGELP